MKFNFIRHYWVFISTFVFVLDRIAKILVLHYLPIEQPINVLPIFNLFFTFNVGAAFGFLNRASGWQGWLFSGIAITVSVALVIWQFHINNNHNRLKIALALILGGTLGNLYDRIIYNHVIDFFDFHFKNWHYATFNIADSAICIGALMLIIDIICEEKTVKKTIKKSMKF